MENSNFNYNKTTKKHQNYIVQYIKTYLNIYKFNVMFC